MEKIVRNKLRYAGLFAVIAMVFVFASDGFGQMTGGYKVIASDDAAAQAAAEFAVTTQSEKSGKEMSLVEIVKAERQVVAGSNFRMCLKVASEGAEGHDATTSVQLVVYVDLKGNRKLTSWTASDCGDDGGEG